jgi:DNA invertase Pin-like site-specific DNA recombinase
MPIAVAIYARSSADFSLPVEDQIETLNGVAAARGWAVSRVFVDRPTPTRRGREPRPGQAGLLSAIRSGCIGKVLVCSIDRLGRSLVELVGLLEACSTSGTSIYLHDRQIDTSTCNGLGLFDLASMMSQHLRQARRDRILQGQAAARSANVRFGRPPLPSAKIEKARMELASGKGVRTVARMAGISPASVSKLKGAMSAAQV